MNTLSTTWYRYSSRFTTVQQITVVTIVYHAKAVYPVSAKSLQWPKKGCEEGSFCSIWGEGSLSSRGHVHVVLRT